MAARINYEYMQEMPDTKLRFVKEVPKINSRRRALFLCECGNHIESAINHVTNCKTTSCGCVGITTRKTNRLTHGYARRNEYHRVYGIRSGMLDRCLRNKKGYERVKVCKRWHSFENFLADMGEPPEGTSLDRIDYTGNYTPKNCRWVDIKTQANNTRRNIRATLNGVTKTIAEWCDELNINRYTVYTRIRKGRTPEEALTTSIVTRA